MSKTTKILGAAMLAGALLQLSACTWVKPTMSAEAVRVAYNGDVTGCREAGQISVSVADKVAFYHRSELKVRDELETLARNQAADLPADTIKPASEPHDGAQNFTAYVCGGVRMHQRDSSAAPPRERRAGEAETFPIKEH